MNFSFLEFIITDAIKIIHENLWEEVKALLVVLKRVSGFFTLSLTRKYRIKCIIGNISDNTFLMGQKIIIFNMYCKRQERIIFIQAYQLVKRFSYLYTIYK